MSNILNFASRQTPPSSFIPNIVSEDISDTVKSESELLDYIFGCDPVTGHPIGDLAFYLGENTRPEIRTFIETNILKDISKSTDSPLHLPDEVINKFRSDLSDDDIAVFSRNHNETAEEYANRMKYYLSNERERRMKERRDAEYQKELSELRKKVLND